MAVDKSGFGFVEVRVVGFADAERDDSSVAQLTVEVVVRDLLLVLH